MKKLKKIKVKGLTIITFEKNTFDFISLTDIAKYKDSERTNYIVQNWMRTRSTVEFLGCGRNYITLILTASNSMPLETNPVSSALPTWQSKFETIEIRN